MRRKLETVAMRENVRYRRSSHCAEALRRCPKCSITSRAFSKKTTTTHQGNLALVNGAGKQV